MSPYTLYFRLVLIVLALGSLAVALGGEPWGPH